MPTIQTPAPTFDQLVKAGDAGLRVRLPRDKTASRIVYYAWNGAINVLKVFDEGAVRARRTRMLSKGEIELYLAKADLLAD